MELFTREEVLNIARKIADDENVLLEDYYVTSKSERVFGYLGTHLALTLHMTSEKGKIRRVFFVKTYERGENVDFLGETGIFKREQDFYMIVLEDLRKYVGNLDWCPEYLFGKERVLVLEDLSEEGFRMFDEGHRSWALDSAHLKKALETLASMHATSIFLESKKGALLPDLYPTVFSKEILYDENKPEAPTRKWIKWQIQDLLQGVDYLHKYSPDQKKLIKKNFEKQIMRVYTLSKKSEKYRNTLTHGDMWKNNLLFRYSEKTPEECRFVDFQFIRYSPPAHDVMHLLHYATVKDTRDRKEPEYLEFYYGHLRKRMQNHGMEIEKVISEEDFIKSCKDYKELALIQSLLSLHYILGPATLKIGAKHYGEYEDYFTNHRKEYMHNFFHDEIYSEKIRDTFYELIENYIFEKLH